MYMYNASLNFLIYKYMYIAVYIYIYIYIYGCTYIIYYINNAKTFVHHII